MDHVTKFKPITLLFPASMIEALDVLVADHNRRGGLVSRAELVRQAVRELLSKQGAEVGSGEITR